MNVGSKRPVIQVQGIWPGHQGKSPTVLRHLRRKVDLVAFNPLIDYFGNDKNVEYLENFTCLNSINV